MALARAGVNAQGRGHSMYVCITYNYNIMIWILLVL